MSNMIEVMAKLRNARNLDVRQSGLVDSAYFAVKVGGLVGLSCLGGKSGLLHWLAGWLATSGLHASLLRVSWWAGQARAAQLLLPSTAEGHTPSFTLQAADKAVKRKQRPPVHEYVRHLVYDRLALGEVTKVRECVGGGFG